MALIAAAGYLIGLVVVGFFVMFAVPLALLVILS